MAEGGPMRVPQKMLPSESKYAFTFLHLVVQLLESCCILFERTIIRFWCFNKLVVSLKNWNIYSFVLVVLLSIYSILSWICCCFLKVFSHLYLNWLTFLFALFKRSSQCFCTFQPILKAFIKCFSWSDLCLASKSLNHILNFSTPHYVTLNMLNFSRNLNKTLMVLFFASSCSHDNTVS